MREVTGVPDVLSALADRLRRDLGGRTRAEPAPAIAAEFAARQHGGPW
jgi:hypothetical protein